MKKHLRPCTKPNQTEHETPEPYQGTQRFSQILCSPQISSYHMQSYFGRMISTAWPRISSSRLSPKTTSASPPTLATGASSAETIAMYMADRSLALVRCSSSPKPACLSGASGERVRQLRKAPGRPCAALSSRDRQYYCALQPKSTPKMRRHRSPFAVDRRRFSPTPTV